MSEGDWDFARDWMKKAGNDLFTARCVLATPEGPTDTPCFHAQQAVEKALKAILTACGVRVGRTHDLLSLLDHGVTRVPELAQHRAACAQLSAYAVLTRYPEEIDEPTREEAAEALQWATAIHAVAARFLAVQGPTAVEDEEHGDQEE